MIIEKACSYTLQVIREFFFKVTGTNSSVALVVSASMRNAASELVLCKPNNLSPEYSL